MYINGSSHFNPPKIFPWLFYTILLLPCLSPFPNFLQKLLPLIISYLFHQFSLLDSKICPLCPPLCWSPALSKATKNSWLSDWMTFCSRFYLFSLLLLITWVLPFWYSLLVSWISQGCLFPSSHSSSTFVGSFLTLYVGWCQSLYLLLSHFLPLRIRVPWGLLRDKSTE